MPITLNLVALRTSYLDRAAAFYTLLGLNFTKHRHGQAPEHYAAELPGAVFELYPLGARIGFQVLSVDTTLAAISDYSAHTRLTAASLLGAGAIITPAKDSEWGRRAVLTDPDSHRVELLQSS